MRKFKKLLIFQFLLRATCNSDKNSAHMKKSSVVSYFLFQNSAYIAQLQRALHGVFLFFFKNVTVHVYICRIRVVLNMNRILVVNAADLN